MRLLDMIKALIVAAVCAALLISCSNDAPASTTDDNAGNTTQKDSVQGMAYAPPDDNSTLQQESGAAENMTGSSASGNSSDNNSSSEDMKETDVTLADIPDFIGGMDFIVGNKAPSVDIVTISEIKSSLMEKGIETGSAKLADSVDDYTSGNHIIIGSPCDNPAAAELLKKEISEGGGCGIFEEGTAMISLFRTSGDSIILYAGGGTGADTRKAGRVLANFDDYTLAGAAVEVKGPASDPSVSLMII